MALCQPNVVGPLSELSVSIRVQGQLPGATVTVFSLKPNLHPVAKGVAIASDQRFPLLSGVQLNAGDLLVAQQELGGEKSILPSGDLGMGVQPKPHSPAEVGIPGLETHPYECGQYVWVSGAIPGAMVDLFANGALYGSGLADEGYARFGLSQGLPTGGAVNTHQVVPALPPGPDFTASIDHLPPRQAGPLPSPVLQPPARGCDASILVTNVYDGALVTIQRGDGSSDTAGFDRNALWFILPKPLDEGEDLIARQEMSKNCERIGDWSNPLKVGPLKPVDPPVVEGPLCLGLTRVRVTNLRPGARVHLQANSDVFDGQIPPDRTWFDFTLPPLKAGSVSATQELCGVTSMPSAAEPVKKRPNKIPSAAVVGPLYDCARTVSIKNVYPGATVQIFARNAAGDAPISDQVIFSTDQGVLPVAPYLRQGDDVYVVQWPCSDKGAPSKTEPVQPLPALEPVRVLDPIFAGDRRVDVQDALPGALVEVFVRRPEVDILFAGSAIADALSQITVVGCNFALQAGDFVFARQTLCYATSEPGRPVAVIEQPKFGPRPFYILGHNPNTISAVKQALADGANAIEPDVNVYDDHPDQLCISHGEGDSGAPSLVQFLTDLHQVAIDFPQLALVVFDCKPKVATAQHGLELLTAIRKHLTFDNQLNVIISVGDLSMTAIFDQIKTGLGPREGLMIDEENDPIAVSNFFTAAGVTNQCFGNGISVLNSILGPNVRPSMERACEFRAASNRTRFIYVWTVNDDDLQREYIRIGVDGIITDDVAQLAGIVKESEFTSLIRRATRLDDPLIPANFAYGLQVHTGDKWMGGTDANVTFTLTGANGSSSKTVNTKLTRRMERNDWNYVTLPSVDLGALLSLTVQRDNQGNAPDWFLDRVIVESYRYGTTKQAFFNRWIDDTTPFTKPLV